MNNETPSLPDASLLAHDEIATLESLALVLEAANIEYRQEEATSTLWVAEEDLEAATEHLRLYMEENQDWPPVKPWNEAQPQTPPTVLVMGVLVLFFMTTGAWTEFNPWFVSGAVDGSAVTRGEWWRLVTGLTLHADTVHLLGNCCLGGVLVHLLSRSVGYGLAWAVLIADGAFANWCNVIARQEPHFSVGFSTVVFAAVGTLAGMQLLRRQKPLWKELVLPLGAGLALLALLGHGRSTN